MDYTVHGILQARLLQKSRVGSLSLLQGIFSAQGSNPGLLHCRQILYQLSHKGSPRILEWIDSPFSSRFSLKAQSVKNHLQCRRPWFDPWVRKIRWRRDRLPTPGFLGFPCGSVGKESACNVGDLGSIPGLGRSPGEGHSYPLQYSGLENSLDYSPCGCRVGHD